MKPPTIVAEIGCNHGGSLATAFKMIDAAAYAGADVVKFQKRDIGSIPDWYANRVRNDTHAFGPTEREHRQALEFTVDQHHELKTYAAQRGLTYAASAWDRQSYKDLLDLGSKYIKIPSAKNIEFLSWNDVIKPEHEIHVAFGMTTLHERLQIMKFCNDTPNRIPYACSSKYPLEHYEVALLEIQSLQTLRHGNEVGYSGHHKGIALDVAAYLLGAQWIERHFTLDRSSKGTDHAASLEPDGLRKLVRDLNAVRVAWKDKPDGLPAWEIESRKKLKGL